MGIKVLSIGLAPMLVTNRYTPCVVIRYVFWYRHMEWGGHRQVLVMLWYHRTDTICDGIPQIVEYESSSKIASPLMKLILRDKRREKNKIIK